MFTGEHSIEAQFDIINITELIVIMTVYGFDEFVVPLSFEPILYPEHYNPDTNDMVKYGTGFRQEDDELIYFATKSTNRTEYETNHSLTFSIEINHFITYASFSVDVSTYRIFNRCLYLEE